MLGFVIRCRLRNRYGNSGDELGDDENSELSQGSDSTGGVVARRPAKWDDFEIRDTAFLRKKLCRYNFLTICWAIEHNDNLSELNYPGELEWQRRRFKGHHEKPP